MIANKIILGSHNPIQGSNAGTFASALGISPPIQNPQQNSTAGLDTGAAATIQISSMQNEITQLQNQNAQLTSELSQLEQNQANPINSLSGAGTTDSTDSTTLGNELASMGMGNVTVTPAMVNEYQSTLSMLEGSLGAGGLGSSSSAGLSMSSLSGVSSTASSALTGLASTNLSALGMLSPTSLDSSLLASATMGTISTGSGLPASNDSNIPWSQSDPLVYDTANLGNSSAEGWLAEQASALPSDQATAVNNLISGARQTLQTDETAAGNNQLSGSNAAALSQQTQNIENVINAFNAADGNSTTGQLLTALNYPGPSSDPFLNGGSSSFLGGGFPISPMPPSPSPIQPLTLGSAGTAAGTPIESLSSGISAGNSLVAQAAPLASTSSVASSNGADPVLTEITGALALVQQETPAYVALAAANDPQNPNAGPNELAGLQQQAQNLTMQANMEEQEAQTEAISNADTQQMEEQLAALGEGPLANQASGYLNSAVNSGYNGMNQSQA